MSSDGTGGGVPSPFGRGPFGGTVGGMMAAAKRVPSRCEARVPGKPFTRRKRLENSHLQRVRTGDLELFLLVLILRKPSTSSYLGSGSKRNYFTPESSSWKCYNPPTYLCTSETRCDPPPFVSSPRRRHRIPRDQRLHPHP